MTDEWSMDLDPEEQDVLRALGRAEVGSRRMEDRIVRTLRQEGLIVPGAAPRWLAAVRLAGLALALAATFFLGAEVGSRRSRSEAPMVAPLIDADVSPRSVKSFPDHTAFHEDLGTEHPLLASDAIGCEQDPVGVLAKPTSY